MLEVGRRTGHPDGDVVQHGWNEHLSHGGGVVPRAGDEHRSVLAPAVVAAGRRDAHVERHGGRLRRQLHHPCCHVGGGPRGSPGGGGGGFLGGVGFVGEAAGG